MLAARIDMTFPEYTPAVIPADNVKGPTQGQWVDKDYAALPDDGKRYEIIDGVLFMSPAPEPGHQMIVGAIFFHLYAAIDMNDLGAVLQAPCDIKLYSGSIVQPDVFVVLNEHLNRIKEKRVMGAPDLIIEVASPSTTGYDRREKQNAYAQAGIPEYWLVEPLGQMVELLLLENGQYHSQGIFHGKAVLPTRVVPQLTIRVEQFFRRAPAS